jgi:serine/threonine-protein kinase
MANEEAISDRDLPKPALVTPDGQPSITDEPVAPGEDRQAIAHGATMAPTTDEARAAAAAANDPLVGTVVAERYRLLERVGEGGMGAVYRGEHVTLRKRVAVKFLHAELSRIPDVVARFEREAVAAANLEHANVVAAHDFGKSAEGTFFLVMEFVDGGSLRALLDAEKQLPAPRAVHIARHIAAALGRAHGLGIVHRDLKPENVVLVDREGDRDFAKVIDFGIAKVSPGKLGEGPALTQAGMVFGTPDYMAPEQALGSKIDHRADLYAFGIMVFEMLVGRRPFDADDVMILLGKHMTAPPPNASELASPAPLPTSVDAVFARLLAKSPGDRFDTASAFVSALEIALGLPTSGTYPPGVLTAVPANIGTPPYGVALPAPSAIHGVNQGAVPNGTTPSFATSADLARASLESLRASTVSLVRGSARSSVATLRAHIADVRSDPERSRKASIGLGVLALLSVILAIATRPSARTSDVSSHPVPAVPRSIARESRRTPPTTSINTAGTTGSVRPSTATSTGTSTSTSTANGTATVNGAAAGGESRATGMPADLAAQLAAYEAQPNVRTLLDSARGRQRGAVITAFETTRSQAPNDPIVSYILGTLYAHERGRSADAIDRYADAVRLNAGFARDPRLIHDVADVFLEARTPPPSAATLLQGPLAAYASDVLIDAALTSRNTVARSRAVALLGSSAFEPYQDATTHALVALAGAHTCDERLEPVEALGREGDARALPYLRAVRTDWSCGGFFSRAQCNPCLTAALPQAIQAIESRSPH